MSYCISSTQNCEWWQGRLISRNQSPKMLQPANCNVRKNCFQKEKRERGRKLASRERELWQRIMKHTICHAAVCFGILQYSKAYCSITGWYPFFPSSSALPLFLSLSAFFPLPLSLFYFPSFSLKQFFPDITVSWLTFWDLIPTAQMLKGNPPPTHHHHQFLSGTDTVRHTKTSKITQVFLADTKRINPKNYENYSALFLKGKSEIK